MIETVRTGAIVALVLAGLFFTFVSTVGVLRLPDLYARTHTASQADTLGAGLSLAGVALALGWGTTTVKTVLLLFFIFVTNPTAAHAISRAAHEEGIEPWTTDDDRTDRELYEASLRPTVPDGGAADRRQAARGTDENRAGGGPCEAGDGEGPPTTGGDSSNAGQSPGESGHDGGNTAGREGSP